MSLPEPDRNAAQKGAAAPSEGYLAYLAKLRRDTRRIRFMQLLLIIVFLAVWEIASKQLWVNPMLTSQPSAIVEMFVTLARDAAFNTVVAEIVAATPELRATNIADGSYFMRVRAVDARGLEGIEATHAFTLKARPEPPLVSVPPRKGKVRASMVEFKWSENSEASAS